MGNMKIFQTILLILVITGSTLMADIIVDANSVDPNVPNNIQEAIDNSRDPNTIIVNPGIYEEHIDYHGRAITITSKDPNDPNIVNNTIIDGNNVGKVIEFCNTEQSRSVLRGITIRGGDIGIHCEGNSVAPRIERCIINLNRIGVMCTDGANITITDTIISKNTEHGTSGCIGKLERCTIIENGQEGIHNLVGTVIDCDVYGNMSHGISCSGNSIDLKESNIYENGGNGICANGSMISLLMCTVSGNKSSGICIGDGSIDMKNCIVSGNEGHGIFSETGRATVVINCTIIGNKGSGLHFLIPPNLISGNIIAQNMNDGIYAYSHNSNNMEKSFVTYNNIFANRGSAYSGSMLGIKNLRHNMEEKPWFAENGYWDKNEIPDGPDENFWVEGDYHLRSEAGRWDSLTQTWVMDDVTSPCLDSGDPDMPVGQEPNPNGGRINLGAYGGTAEASKSAGVQTICTEYPEMDFNNDCKVDQLDLELFMEHWLECNLDPQDACWPDGIPEYPLLQ